MTKLKDAPNYSQTLTAEYDEKDVFFTSDPHFGSNSMAKSRGFKDAQEMEDVFVENWNKVVGEEHTVIIAGDFCMGKSDEWVRILQRLNGKKILVKGNHDSYLSTNRGKYFARICYKMNITINGQKINVKHRPSTDWTDPSKIQLFGHYHTRNFERTSDLINHSQLSIYQYDIGVDNNNYTPVSFNSILQRIEAKKNDTYIDAYIYEDDYHKMCCPSLGLTVGATALDNCVASMNESVALLFQNEQVQQYLQKLGWSFENGVTPPIIDKDKINVTYVQYPMNKFLQTLNI